MTIQVTIRHADEGSAATLKVTVVTVGNPEASEQVIQLTGGQEATVHVHKGQFVMVDEKGA
ncbi:hypothetical protein AQPW35_33960 [Rubrivivax pictus]|uniref:Uncharacterized protein n=1 Tax=Pseudaquabacterium pictum TaxID=2315236 RepID=A0A480AWZ2_9BURK|nr:hypothetical protein AQPW35_33960 [Rubrivivax pictus]